MRTSGILFPIFSLPGKYGIGCRLWRLALSVLLDICGESVSDQP